MGVYYAVEHVARGEVFFLGKVHRLAIEWEFVADLEGAAVPLVGVFGTGEALTAALGDARAAERLWVWADEGRALVRLLCDATSDRMYELRQTGSSSRYDYAADGVTYIGDEDERS